MDNTKISDTPTFMIENELKQLYSQPFPSSRTGPLFNAFSYPTKISAEAIALYIVTHTKVGDTVLDSFAGSGTTGLAAKLCDQPTPNMIEVADKLNLKPKWGPRKAYLYELGGIGSFVADVMCNPPCPDDFEYYAQELVKEAYKILTELLVVKDENNNDGVLRHVIWSEVLICPICQQEHTFWEVAIKESPLQILPLDQLYECPNCSREICINDTKRATEDVYDELLSKNIERKKRVPVRIYGKTGTHKWQRKVNDLDLELLKKIEEIPLPDSIPVEPLILGDLHRAGYHFGITHLHHLYTRRNLICFGTIWKLIESYPKNIQNALKLLVLSYNQSHSTLMTRVVVKKSEADFVLTGAQSGVLYISNLPVEKNILEGINRKIKTIKSSFDLVYKSYSEVIVYNESSTNLKIENKSVDYIFTDPPFADFIPYSEINQINELWLGKRTDTRFEAIISPYQNKGLTKYANLMQQVFNEMHRVLKDHGMATIIFHAAKAEVWRELQKCYKKADFSVLATNVLDKLQDSFKQVVSSVSVKGDPVILLGKKNGIEEHLTINDENILLNVIKNSRNLDGIEQTPERIYSRYVTLCLEKGITVNLDATEVYARVKGGIN
ncbi:DNA methyltransferase [Acinetobacter pittii]|uniref:DNA methyltransferase n=1 Tax=Acinetobacter pittii TaxID=48296 RepID=UPI003AF689A0